MHVCVVPVEKKVIVADANPKQEALWTRFNGGEGVIVLHNGEIDEQRIVKKCPFSVFTFKTVFANNPEGALRVLQEGFREYMEAGALKMDEGREIVGYSCCDLREDGTCAGTDEVCCVFLYGAMFDSCLHGKEVRK